MQALYDTGPQIFKINIKKIFETRHLHFNNNLLNPKNKVTYAFSKSKLIMFHTSQFNIKQYHLLSK